MEKICLPNASEIAREIKNICKSTTLNSMQKDADYVSGMLFVMQETGLADTLTEFNEINDSVKEKDIIKFKRASDSAAKRIDDIDWHKCIIDRMPYLGEETE